MVHGLWERQRETNHADMGVRVCTSQKDRNVTAWTWGNHNVMMGGAPTCRNCGGSTGEHEREPFTNIDCP